MASVRERRRFLLRRGGAVAATELRLSTGGSRDNEGAPRSTAGLSEVRGATCTEISAWRQRGHPPGEGEQFGRSWVSEHLPRSIGATTGVSRGVCGGKEPHGVAAKSGRGTRGLREEVRERVHAGTTAVVSDSFPIVCRCDTGHGSGPHGGGRRDPERAPDGRITTGGRGGASSTAGGGGRGFVVRICGA